MHGTAESRLRVYVQARKRKPTHPQSRKGTKAH